MKRNADGTFPANTSGNPGGRPRAPHRLRGLYDKNDDDNKNYQRLVYWRDQDEDSKASLRAIEILFERRYGKAAVVDDDGEPVRDTVIQVVVPKYDEEKA